MQTFQGNTFDRQSTKADTTSLYSFEPQNDFQICVKSFQIACLEQMKRMQTIMMSELSSLYMKMDSLSERHPYRLNMNGISKKAFDFIHPQFTFGEAEKDDGWHSFAKHTEVNTSDLISTMTESLRIAESFTKKNENKDQQYNGNVHRTQTSETPNTPQQSTLNTYGCNTIAAFDDPPSYEEAMKTKKCELGDGVNDHEETIEILKSMLVEVETIMSIIHVSKLDLRILISIIYINS